jgi:putative endonuclease
MAVVYIIHSTSLNKFYTGISTLPIEERLNNHNDQYYDNKYTSKGIPWTLFWHLQLEDIDLAKCIEKHIKDMKSKVYIENLKKHPEIAEKLIVKYMQKSECR